MKCSLIGLTVILLVCTAGAQPDLNISYEAVISNGMTNTFHDIEVEGGVAYVCSHYYFEILDVSDNNPQHLVRHSLPGDGLGISVDNGYAYVAANAGGVVIYDVQDPASAFEVATIPAYNDGYSRDVFAVNGYLYVASHLHGLRIFDVSDPTDPVEVSWLAVTNGFRVWVEGDYAYLVRSGTGLWVINVSDPENPVQVGYCFTPGQGRDIRISDNVLYLATIGSGIRAIDISDPFNPVEVDDYNRLGSADCEGLEVNGNYLYASFNNSNHVIFDISIPGNLDVEVPFSNVTDKMLKRMAVEGNTLYTIDNVNVVIRNVTNPLDLIETNVFPWTASVSKRPISVKNGDLFVSEHYFRIFPTDGNDYTEYGHIFSENTYDFGVSVITDDDIGYVLSITGGGMHVLDVSNPSQIAELAWVDLPGPSMDISISGDYAYVIQNEGALSVVDISNPASPLLVSEQDLGSSSNSVCAVGTTVFIGKHDGFYAYDMQDPQNPVLLDNDTNRAKKIIIDDSIAYVSTNGGNFNIYDVSDPENLVLLSMTFIPPPANAWDLALEGELLFVACESEGLHVFDISDPTTPVEVGYYTSPTASTSFYAYAVAVDGDYAYVREALWVSVLDISELYAEPLMVLDFGAEDEIEVPAGGSFDYDLDLISNLPGPYLVDVWLEADLPNGSTYGPLRRVDNVLMGPNTEFNIDGITQDIPAGVDPGLYTYRVEAGEYPNFVIASDELALDVNAGGVFPGMAQSWGVQGFDFPGSGEFKLAGETDGEIPTEYSLGAAYPNPFNAMTTVTVALPDAADLTVTVFNTLGQEVAQLANGRLSAGTHTLTFDASDLSSGIYFIHAAVPGRLDAMQKVVLVK